MPLREDLLEPIPGDNPSGLNLYEDRLFVQIEEARTEDLDSLPAGEWSRAQKKADHVLAIKLAGDALAKRSKDLRLAWWLAESQFRREGCAVLPACLKLLKDIQEKFWDTLYPPIEEGGYLDLRLVEMEKAGNKLAAALRRMALTRDGLSYNDYMDSRQVGYESEASGNSDKREARQDAIEQGRLTAEDFDAAVEKTPKAFYVELEAELVKAQEKAEELNAFQQERYGSDYPNLGRLTETLDDVRRLVTYFLTEKRKTDPDPVAEPEPDVLTEEAEPEPGVVAEPVTPEPVMEAVQEAVKAAAPAGASAGRGKAVAKVLTPYEMVVQGAEQLFEAQPNSPAPYLVAAGLRLGETRLQPGGGYGFAAGPPSEVRQRLKKLANEGDWSGLLAQSAAMLGEEYARAWLDLHRYVWRAASECGYGELAQAVATTVRGLLTDVPGIREWSLDDDTPAANPETLRWIDAEILPPVAEAVPKPPPEPEPVVFQAPAAEVKTGEPAAPSVFEIAMQAMRRGRADEAIAMMVREANRQANGRERFQRRVEVAQLCLAGNREDIAYPILAELNEEIEKRQLELWESEDLLVKPMTMLLGCMESRGAPAEAREALFTRLCRLDPQAALTVRR
jgi:type VI secretion system protein ImpA